MAFKKIADDQFILYLRKLFRASHKRELEFVYTQESEAVSGCDYYGRAINYHQSMLPWIEDCFPLADAVVLEIGGGEGAATLALSQRCKQIDCFDINATSLLSG